MKTKLRYISLLLVAALFCSVMCACQTSEEEGLVVAITADREGFCYFGENGEYEGLDVELALMIADKLGEEITFKNIAYEGMDMAAKKNDADIFIGDFSEKSAITEYATLTGGFYSESSLLVVPAGSDITGAMGVSGKMVGAVVGSEQFDRVGLYYKCNMNSFNTVDDVMKALTAGIIDAAVIDSRDAQLIPEGFSALAEPFAQSTRCIAVKDGWGDLDDRVSAALSELIADGTVDSLLAKYGIN